MERLWRGTNEAWLGLLDLSTPEETFRDRVHPEFRVIMAEQVGPSRQCTL